MTESSWVVTPTNKQDKYVDQKVNIFAENASYCISEDLEEVFDWYIFLNRDDDYVDIVECNNNAFDAAVKLSKENPGKKIWRFIIDSPVSDGTIIAYVVANNFKEIKNKFCVQEVMES